MKRKLIILFFIWLSFLLQTTVFSTASLFAVRPNLLLIVTVSMAFMQGEREGIATGFLSGLLIDLFAGPLLGYYALLYMTVGYFCGKLSRIFFNTDIRIPVFLVALSDFLLNLAIYLTRFLFRDRMAFAVYFSDIILPEMIFTAILTFLSYRLLHAANQRLLNREREENASVWIRD